MRAATGFLYGRGKLHSLFAGNENVLARLPNYVTNPAFEGQFDATPFFDLDVEIEPPLWISRHTFARATQ